MIVETFAALELEPLDWPAVLVASHGPFAWGASVDDAVENAIALEAVAASAHRSLAPAGALEAIDGDTTVRGFADAVRWNQAYYHLARGL